MFSEKYSIRILLRTPLRSILFFFLLGILTAVLCLGFTVYDAVGSFLRKCNESYHTTVSLEYIGARYPDGHVLETSMLSTFSEDRIQLEKIRSLEECLSYNSASSALAFHDSINRQDNIMTDRNASVFSATILTYDKTSEAYVGVIKECLYSAFSYEGLMVFISPSAIDEGKAPGSLPKSRTYWLDGHFFDGRNSYIWFDAERIYEEATEELLAAAEYYRRINNSFRAEYITDTYTCLPLSQEWITLSSGRLFTEEEYRTDAPRIIVSRLLADYLDLQTGDTVPLSVYISEKDQGLYERGTLLSVPETLYEVVGIFEYDDTYGDTIFLPSSGSISEFRIPTGHYLGSFSVENASSDDFYKKALSLLPSGYRLTLYDGGYRITAEPYQELLRIISIFLAVVLLVTLAVIFLYCNIYILHEQEISRLMLNLGASKCLVLRFFLSGMLFLWIPASLAGIAAGSLLRSRVFQVIREFAEKNSAELQESFSSTLLTVIKRLEFLPDVSASVSIFAAFLLLGLLLLFSMLCTFMTFRADRATKRRKTVQRKHPDKKFRLGRNITGILKYSILSLFRNSLRSVSVFLIFLCVFAFYGILCFSEDSYADEMKRITESTRIRGYISSENGRFMNSLVIRSDYVKMLYDLGFTDHITLTRDYSHYRFLGIVTYKDGTPGDALHGKQPVGSFSAETLYAQMSREPSWVTCNRLTDSPQFYYSQDPGFEWLEGFAEKDLLQPGNSYCVLPRSLMERNLISLGDTVRFFYFLTDSGYPEFLEADLLVIGSYEMTGAEEVIYSPSDIDFDPEREDTLSAAAMTRMFFHSCVFSLKNTADLPLLREKLASCGFSPVSSGSIRRNYAVIDDAVYLNTLNQMDRQKLYLYLLYGFLEILTMILGFALSNLLMNSRKSEISLMRALGTGKIRILSNFGFEQLTLMLLGGGTALLIQKLLIGNFSEKLRILCPAFAVLWVLGALLRLTLLLRRPDSGLLKPKE